mgnify:CR=1 FL=1
MSSSYAELLDHGGVCARDATDSGFDCDCQHMQQRVSSKAKRKMWLPLPPINASSDEEQRDDVRYLGRVEVVLVRQVLSVHPAWRVRYLSTRPSKADPRCGNCGEQLLGKRVCRHCQYQAPSDQGTFVVDEMHLSKQPQTLPIHTLFNRANPRTGGVG